MWYIDQMVKTMVKDLYHLCVLDKIIGRAYFESKVFRRIKLKQIAWTNLIRVMSNWIDILVLYWKNTKNMVLASSSLVTHHIVLYYRIWDVCKYSHSIMQMCIMSKLFYTGMWQVQMSKNVKIILIFVF
jgi:hypothetical protein